MVKPLFKNVPRFRIFLRTLPMIALVAAASLAGVGFFAGTPGFKPETDRAPATSPRLDLRAEAYYLELYQELRHPMEGCSSSTPMSDFQAGRCTKWWKRVATECALGLVPFVCIWISLLLALDSGRATYRRIRKKISATPYVVKGRVTHPARIRSDFFGWFYGFRSIAVEMPDRTQARVYFASDSPLPLPGETVAVFPLGVFAGKDRFAGTIYAPHVAVLAATGS